jgi:hypothetical protein
MHFLTAFQHKKYMGRRLFSLYSAYMRIMNWICVKTKGIKNLPILQA